MKKLLLLLLLASPMIGQENINQDQQDEIMYKRSLIPIFLLGSYQFTMIDDHNLTFDASFNLNIELHVNASFKPHIYSAFVYTRIGGYFPMNYSNSQLQVGFGISGYIYNNRDEKTYLGWSMMMGAGGLINVNIVNKYNDIGYELFLRGQYNFHKYVGFVIGLSFEHMFAMKGLWDEEFSYLDNDINIFNIGITVGLAF